MHYKSESNTNINNLDTPEVHSDAKKIHAHFNRSVSHSPRIENTTVTKDEKNEVNSAQKKERHNSADIFVHARPQDRKTKRRSKSTSVDDQEKYPDIPNVFNVESISHVDNVQKTKNNNECFVVRRARSQSESEKVDPLQFVEDVSSIKKVQASFLELHEQATKVSAVFRRPLLEKASSISSHDSDLTYQEQQMLDDDCFNWEEDKLLLEINEVIEGTSTPSCKDSDASPVTPGDVPFVHTQQPSPSGDIFHDNHLKINRSESGTSLSSRGSSSKSMECISHKASAIRARLIDKLKNEDLDGDILLKMTPPPASSIVPDEYGLPLSLFTKVFKK